LQPTRLAVGHGNALASPLNAMDAAIRVAERKLNKATVHA
jgi:hypothetical protein